MSKLDKLNMESIEKAKLQSMKDNTEDSNNSVTGYHENGNPAEVQQERRNKSSRNR